MDNEKMMELLQSIAARLGSLEEKMATLGEAPAEKTPAAEVPVYGPLKSPVLDGKKPLEKDVLLCLDFGTARSKAFASRGEDEQLLDLAIGQRAGQTTAIHSLASCIYIAESGHVFFGQQALAKSEHAVQRGSRRRIESFKGMITNSAVGTDLHASPIEPAQNPTDVRLSEGDVLTLYLAYLTDMAATELADRHGLSRYARRRFTMPVFTGERFSWAQETLRRHYAEAVLVADALSGRWREGIDVREAQHVLRLAAAEYRKALYLIDMALVEPRAAFASTFRNHVPRSRKRYLMTIVDIGAGTTDFASFAVVEEPEKGFKMFLVKGSVHAVRKAGDEVDRLLQEHILRQLIRSHRGLSDDALARIKADLSLRKRDFKEQLFRNGRLDYELADDTRGTVTADAFLADHAVKQFTRQLESEFEKSLAGMHPSWLRDMAEGRLTVVLTGGGARLPMVQSLGRKTLGAPVTVQCSAAPPIPKWVTDDFPELSEEFPHLAVAIGGSSRDIPEFPNKEFVAFEGLMVPEGWRLERARREA